MQFVADLHVHTVASGHAYSTVKEIARVAADKGLAMIALTDHGPGMPGGAHAYHFSNQTAMPDFLFGVRVLKGIEANVMDRSGRLDLDDLRLGKLDIVAVGLHTVCSPNGSIKENTAMMLAALQTPFVDIIVHPGNPEYLIDEEAVVKEATRCGVALEVNNSSLTVSRKGSLPHCDHIVGLAKQFGTKLIVGSDSHFCETVGEFSVATELLNKNGILPEQVINTSIERVLDHLNRRKNHNPVKL
jgi:putative hydrolase